MPVPERVSQNFAEDYDTIYYENYSTNYKNKAFTNTKTYKNTI